MRKKVTEFIEAHLPIAQFMGLEVESYNGQTLILSAPLEPNINDKLTAFGGSLYNASVLACWGIVYLKTLEAGIQCTQVVAKASIAYKAPVQGPIRAICHAPDDQVIKQFIEDFKAHGKAKITLEATVECDGNLAVEFEGKYAIIKTPENSS